MPIYEYRCNDCGRPVELFFKTYAEFDTGEKRCPNCQSLNLKRRIKKVGIAKSESSRFSSMDDDSALDDLADADPATLGRYMRRMAQETGEDLGQEFSEVVERLEKGEDPESIEQSMALGDDGSGESGMAEGIGDAGGGLFGGDSLDD